MDAQRSNVPGGGSDTPPSIRRLRGRQESTASSRQARHQKAEHKSLWTMWKKARFFHEKDLERFALFFGINLFLLITRLLIVKVNAIYLVHSIVIFLDLLYANMFVPSPRLSVAMIATAIVWITVYSIDPNFVWELIETASMAVIASVYDLNKKRKKLKEMRQSGVPAHMHDLVSEGSFSMQGSVSSASPAACLPVPGGDEKRASDGAIVAASTFVNARAVRAAGISISGMQHRKKFQALIRETMMEHVEEMPGYFLISEFFDGASGVLYNSFIGLIVVEILNQSLDKKAYLWRSQF